VEVDDVLANGCVYVKDRGVFVTRVPDGPTIAAYKKQIAGRQTVLERVRKMPDQTYTQAMAKTHHKAQDNGPVMLSLACDNNKFVVQREGSVQYADIVGVSPRFGSAGNNGLTRHMDGGWLPAPVVTVTDGGIVYSERAFVAPFGKDGRSLGVIEYTIKNPGASSADVSLALAFPGDSTELSAVSNGIICRRSGRLLAWTDTSSVDGLRADAQSGAVKITGTLGAGEKALCSVYIPTWEMKPQDCALIGGNTNLFASFEAYWKDVMAPAMQVELPDKHVSDAIRASQVHCLIAARNEGDGKLIAPWIASMAYGPLESESNSIILGMDLMGHSDFARKSLDYFIHNYNPSGYLTTGYTVMGTGWHLWSVGEHYRLTRDAKWVKSVAPEVDRVCQWVTKQTEKTRRLDVQGNKVPEYGLMPPGVMADWNVYAYYNCLNGYFYAGLEGAGRALADTGYPGSQSLLASAAELRGNILRGYRWTQARTPVLPLQDGTWVPGYPSQLYVPAPTGDFFPGEDGNRSWCYDVEVGAHHLVPLGVMDANSPETAEMLDHMEDVQFLSDGWFDYPGKDSVKDWFNLGGFSKVQPYYSRNAEIYAMRDDVKPFVRSYFNAMASLLNTENLSFWEHFSSNGAWNKTHETGYFLQQSRFMLVDERGDDLWLAPFVTNNWMKDGMAVAARNAPTAFGPVSYRIKSSVKSGYIEAVIDPPTRTSPKMIVIRLRHPEGKRMKSVTVNGRRYADFDPVKECVRLKPTGATMTVRARY
jgi:hypothetical protein